VRLASADWWKQVLAAVEKATEVDLATYMFDDTALFQVLLRRLSDNVGFKLNILLDEEVFVKGETPQLQRSRVEKLQKKGQAQTQQGCMHLLLVRHVRHS
jgi:hypothetical protein